jgi:hypothetical protein
MYLPLLLHTWFGGLAMSSLLAGGFYALRSEQTSLAVSSYLLKIGLVLLAVQSLLGVSYFLSISEHSPYLLATITGNTAIAQDNFWPLFVVFLLAISILWASSLTLFLRIRKRQKSLMLSLIVMSSAFLGVPLGESLNDASRMPFMLIEGTGGVPMDQFANLLVPVSWNMAYWGIIAALVTITVFLLTLFLVYRGKSGQVQFENTGRSRV